MNKYTHKTYKVGYVTDEAGNKILISHKIDKKWLGPPPLED